MVEETLRSHGVDFERCYSGTRVLVTGHTGFKGGWLSAWLIKLGAEVFGVSLMPPDQPNLFEALGLAERMTSRVLDIRNLHELSEALERHTPEIVFHLAAQPLVRQSYADPIETFETNVLGTANVLEACRSVCCVKAIVCVTTDKVYANNEWHWPYRENDRLGGIDPYSASKACAELIAFVYQRNLLGDRGPKLATVRGGNVVGGGDWSIDRIVPDIVRAINAKQPIELRNPNAVRPWQHVLELCEGYLEIGARLARGEDKVDEAWNFGPRLTNEVTVATLVSAMLKIGGRADWKVTSTSSPFHEAQLLRLDISKALARLHWRPRLNIEQTLRWTSEWYSRFHEASRDAWGLTSDQIDAFEVLRAGIVDIIPSNDFSRDVSTGRNFAEPDRAGGGSDD